MSSGLDVLLWIVLGCHADKQVKQITGEQLLEAYYEASCELMTSAPCIELLAECGTPSSPYGDIADCMNSFVVSHQHCGVMSQEIEQQSELVQACIDNLQVPECTPDTVCPGGESVLRDAECEDVLIIFSENCSGFSW